MGEPQHAERGERHVQFGALFAGLQIAVEHPLDGAQALVEGLAGQAAAAWRRSSCCPPRPGSGAGSSAGRCRAGRRGRRVGRAAVRRSSWTRMSSRSAYSSWRRPMSDSSWNGLVRGVAGRAASPRRRGPPRGRSGRCRRGPSTSEPTLTTASGSRLQTERLSRSTSGRQGWEERSASSTPRRSGASAPTERGTGRRPQLLGQPVLRLARPRRPAPAPGRRARR